MALLGKAAVKAERMIYRIAGLPVAIAALLIKPPDDPAGALRAIYAHEYWDATGLSDLVEIASAMLLWPIGLLVAASWFTWRNGAVVRKRCGTSMAHQFVDEIRVYLSSGILPPWYYIFELFDAGSRPHSFLNRFETKQGYYHILRRRRGSASPLSDKYAFARRCRRSRIPIAPILAIAEDGEASVDHLPRRDLFLKPRRGRGGAGAERWDHVGDGRYVGANGTALSERELLERLRQLSRDKAYIVQPRLTNCRQLADLNNGALSTVRILTCLDEKGRPEAVSAAFRMAVGDNHQVDNFHAGGIAAVVELDSGKLGIASNLGMDAAVGWLDRHPVSGSRIGGRKVPYWREVQQLAERTHRAFDDWAIVGWDIAVTAKGPVVVEGNSGPDLDIMQRSSRSGLAGERLGQLLLHHLTH